MARGHNGTRRWTPGVSTPHYHNCMHKKQLADNNNVQNVQNIHEAIDRHWESMPATARKFLLENSNFLSIHKLARFWHQATTVEYTRGGIAGSVCGASWFIALNYLKLGMFSEARALTLNGAFLHQCVCTPIEDIVELCGPNWNDPIKDYHVQLFSRGFYSVRAPQTMEAYLQKGLPAEYQHMMASFVNISKTDNAMQYVQQIGDDWTGSSAKSHKKSNSKTSDGETIQLVLVDASSDEERQSFDIGSSTTLKTLFNDYADKRGVSLRSLRFTYHGQTLFLSSVSGKTPDEMNMRDQDIITVHSTESSQEPSSSDTAQKSKSAPKKSKSSKVQKKTKGKGKKKQGKKVQIKQEMTLEEYKSEHSKVLSKLHEEAEPRLKSIRTRLNSMDLERQPPKQKKRKNKKKKSKVAPVQVLPDDTGLGGKAGKPFYAIQVGEVQNLYKTAKPSPNKVASSTLDLHGYTREEALAKLDESLDVWVETAMQGEYPFTIPATIVCGCGSQVLSETVEEWIKTKRTVCNAPKTSRN